MAARFEALGARVLGPSTCPSTDPSAGPSACPGVAALLAEAGAAAVLLRPDRYVLAAARKAADVSRLADLLAEIETPVA